MAAEAAASAYTRPINSFRTTFSEGDFQGERPFHISFHVMHFSYRLSALSDGYSKLYSYLIDALTGSALGTSPVSSSPPVGERKLFSDVTRLGFAAACDSPSLRTEQSVDVSATALGEASYQSCK